MQSQQFRPHVLPTPIIVPPPPIPLKDRSAYFHEAASIGAQDISDFDSEPPRKRRRRDRACDYCRRRKIKCDGPLKRDHVCSNCVLGRRSCTYIETSKPRGPSKAYVTALEDKIERLESIVNQLFPNSNYLKELGPPVIRDSWKFEGYQQNYSERSPDVRMAHTSSSQSTPVVTLTPTVKPGTKGSLRVSSTNRTTHLIFKRTSNSSSPNPHNSQSASSSSSLISTPPDESSNDSSEEVVECSIDGRRRLNLTMARDSSPANCSIRFHGRNSTAKLVEITRQFKHLSLKKTKSHIDCENTKHNEGKEKTVDDSISHGLEGLKRSNKPDNEEIRASRRVAFWTAPKWEMAWKEKEGSDTMAAIESLIIHFPPEEIAQELFNLYFEHSNPYIPLLHRPTFDRQWKSQLHRENVWFAMICMLIFALASRWINDTGDGANNRLDNDVDWAAMRWKWFSLSLDAMLAQRSLFGSATLFEIQFLILISLFLRGSSSGPIGWLFISLGIRKAQDVGAHRRKVYRPYPNAEDELWKRAFWILLVFDRITGAALGRGNTVLESDFDLDLPLEVDDEYWDTGDGNTDFKQPSYIPSKICGFTQFIKLAQILAFTSKALYPINMSVAFHHLFQDNRITDILRQWSTAMDVWTENVPAHLRWSENITDRIFASQSATLYSLFHLLWITTWRQFCAVPSLNSLSIVACKKPFTVLGMCAVSVRELGRILKSQVKGSISNIPHLINVALVCGGMSTMIIWEVKKKFAAIGKGRVRKLEIEGTGIHVSDLLDDLKISITLLESMESGWEWAQSILQNLRQILPSDEDEDMEEFDTIMSSYPPMRPLGGITNMIHLSADFDGGELSSRLSSFQDEHTPSVHCYLQDNVPVTHVYGPIPNRSFVNDAIHFPSVHVTNGASEGLKNPNMHHQGFMLPRAELHRPYIPQQDTAHPVLRFPTPSVPVRYPYETQLGTSSSPSSIKFPASKIPGVHRDPTKPDHYTQPQISHKNVVHLPDLQHRSQTNKKDSDHFSRGRRGYSLLSSSNNDDDRRPIVQPQNHRVRAISLMESPSPEIRQRSIPSISSLRRRTSVPELQSSKRTGSENALTGQKQATTQIRFEHFNMTDKNNSRRLPLSDSTSIGFAITERGSTVSMEESEGEPRKAKSRRARDWGGEISYYSPDNIHEGKPLRSTEFRHWNKYPALSSSTGTTDTYIQPKFIHETFNR